MWFEAEKRAQGAVLFFERSVPPAHKVKGHNRVALSTKALQTKEGNWWPNDNCHLWAIPSQKAFVALWLRAWELTSVFEIDQPETVHDIGMHTDDPPRSLSPPSERAISTLVASPVAPPQPRSRFGDVHLH